MRSHILEKCVLFALHTGFFNPNELYYQKAISPGLIMLRSHKGFVLARTGDSVVLSIFATEMNRHRGYGELGNLFMIICA